MTNKDNSVEEEIDKELYAFFYSATDEQELVHDIQRSVDKAKQAITTLLEQSERKARIKTVEVLKKDVNTILNKWYRNRPLETVGSSFGGWEIKLRKELQDRISALKGEQ